MIKVTTASVTELVDKLMAADKNRIFRKSDDLMDSEYQTLFSDRSQISKLLKDLMTSRRTLQELRDALPDCVIPFAGEMLQIDRVESVERVLRYDRPLLFRYNALLQKIEMYAATHLLF